MKSLKTLALVAALTVAGIASAAEVTDVNWAAATVTSVAVNPSHKTAFVVTVKLVDPLLNASVAADLVRATTNEKFVVGQNVQVSSQVVMAADYSTAVKTFIK